MLNDSLFSRRQWLRQAGTGLGLLALPGLLECSHAGETPSNPLAVRQPTLLREPSTLFIST